MTSRVFLFFFFPLVFIRLCTINSSPRVGMPVSNLTVMSWGRAFRRNDLNCSACQKDISCWLRANWKHRTFFVFFCPHQQNLRSPPGPLVGFGSLQLSPLLENEKQVDGSLFGHTGGDPACITDGAWCTDRMRLRKVSFFPHSGSAIYLHLPSPFHTSSFIIFLSS